MRIELNHLKDGSNPFRFEIAPAALNDLLKEVDELYHDVSEPVVVDLDLQKFEDTLQLKGSVAGPIGFACARCLEENRGALDLRLNWMLLPREKFLGDDVSDEEGRELTADDLDVSFYDSDTMDLMELVREAVLLDLPPIPRCDVDKCKGDEYLRALPAEGPSDLADPRWAPLLQAKTLKN